MPFLVRQRPGSPSWIPSSTVHLAQAPKTKRFKVYFDLMNDVGYAPDDGRDPRVWNEDEIAYKVDSLDPKGPRGRFETDLASVPSPLWGLVASYGTQTLPAILHDWQHVGFRREREEGARRTSLRRQRRLADHLFRTTLRESGSAPLRSWIMWSAVRVFGHKSILYLSIVPVLAGITLWVTTALVLRPALTAVTPVATWLCATGLALLLPAVLVLSIESGEPSGPARLAPAGAASLIGACAIAVVVAPVVAPVALTTGLIELVIGAGEAMRAEVRTEQLAPRVAVTWAAPGDSTSDAEPATVR